jgi:ATP/maltotriose-dependent transcriptional regulator MalT
MVTDASGAAGAYHGTGMLEARLFDLVAQDASRDGIDPALCEGQTARLVHLLGRSRGAVQFSEDICEQLVLTIGSALASSIAVLDPEVVLLSGWIELVSQALLERIVEQVRRFVPRMPAMQFASLGGDCVVIGAALAAFRAALADVQVLERAM